MMNPIDEAVMLGGMKKLASQLADTVKSDDIVRTALTVSRNRRPMLTFIDDDCSKAFLTKWLPLMVAKNIPITAAAVTDWVESGTSMSWEDLATISASGAEIVCHSKSHDVNLEYTNGAVDDIETSFAAAKAALIAHGYPGDIIVYPGATGDVENVRLAARRVFNAGILSGGIGANTPPVETYRLVRYPLESATTPTLDYFKSVIDGAVSSNGWVVFMSHAGYGIFDEDMLAIISNLVDYAMDLGVDIVTVREGLNTIGNIVDGQYISIGADGSIVGNGTGAGMSIAKYNYFSLLSDFPAKNTCIDFINASNNRCFPFITGWLITRKYGTYGSQTAIDAASGKEWYRFLSGTNVPGEFNPQFVHAGAFGTFASNGFARVGNPLYNTDTGKPLWVKTAGARTVTKFEITHGATNSGNITIHGYAVAVTAGMTPLQVAAAIAGTSMLGYNVVLAIGKPIVYIMRVVAISASFGTFTDTDGTGATATVTNVVSGAAPVIVDADGATVTS